MERHTKKSVYPLTTEEAKTLKARVYDLSELGAKQILYGIIQALNSEGKILRPFFEEILDDGAKYSDSTKRS